MRHLLPLFLTAVLCASFYCVQSLHAQDNTKNQQSEDEDAVVLLDEQTFTVKGPHNARLSVHRIIKVYNERGKKFGAVGIYENKFVKCKDVEGKILDETGKELKKLKDDDIIKTTWLPGYTLYDDTKYRFFELAWARYPYTVEYRYEQEFQSLFFWPDWYPQEDVPVLQSTYLLEIPGGIHYNIHPTGIEVEPLISKKGDHDVYLWRLENIESRVEEDQSPPENDI